MSLTHFSLFSGIGGIDLAAEAAGFTSVCQCEWAAFPAAVLASHWPDVPRFQDITTVTKEAFFEKTGLRTVTLISGGFPCQPFSTAGRQRGFHDERYLWPEMLGVIRSVRPRWVVGENVLGIVNWSKGLVFEQVCSDLEAEGYEVQPFVIPACGVNAPHRRYRTWFVAHRSDARLEDVRRKRQNTVLSGGITSDTQCFRGYQLHQDIQSGQSNGKEFDNVSGKRNVADTNCKRLQGCKNKRSVGEIRTEQQKQFAGSFCPHWQDFPTQSPVCSRNDGLSYGLDGITFPKWRKESIKAYGNAIVPQLAYRIFETINEYEKMFTNERQ